MIIMKRLIFKVALFCLVLILGINMVRSQDIHFSFMDYSPLTLNPALAGANSDLQFTSNYRTQWNSVATPFTTIGFAGDMRLNSNKRNKEGHLAGGLNFFNDQAGESRISTNNAALTVAYHLMIDDKQTIGLGIQTGLGQRSLDAANGKWGSQYDGLNYNPDLPSNETFANPSFAYFDASAGMVYTYGSGESRIRSNDQLSINAGYAVYHVNRPSFSFIGNGEDPLYMRHSIFANGSVGIGASNFSIDPGFYLQVQGPSREILTGADLKVMLTEGSKRTGNIQEMTLAFGVYYRNKDATIARMIFNYAGLGIGFAYDFNVSSLSAVSNNRGGAELFLRWRMDDPFTKSKTRI